MTSPPSRSEERINLMCSAQRPNIHICLLGRSRDRGVSLVAEHRNTQERDEKLDLGLATHSRTPNYIGCVGIKTIILYFEIIQNYIS